MSKRPGWEKVRDAVIARDGGKCRALFPSGEECGRPYSLHVHHVIPRSLGGTDEPFNLITMCEYCHREMHSSTGKALVPVVADALNVALIQYSIADDASANYWQRYEEQKRKSPPPSSEVVVCSLRLVTSGNRRRAA